MVGAVIAPAVAIPANIPDSPRVVYDHNPLAEVICQLRFPRILKIDSQAPDAFQELIRSEYPGVVESANTLVPPGAVIPSSTQRGYDFVSDDSEWKVSLTSQFVSLSTLKYHTWGEFKTRLEVVLNAVASVYQPRSFVRVGLRYRDVIKRSDLGLAGASWKDLLNPVILGELTANAWELSATHVARELVLALAEDARVRLIHGFAKLEGDDENCYLIDADFFRETKTENQHALAVLDSFNAHAGRLFRWCISPTLNQALGPRPVT